MKLDLQDLMVAIDRGFACEMVVLEAELIRDGVCRESIDAMLSYRREQYATWREHSFRSWSGRTLH